MQADRFTTKVGEAFQDAQRLATQHRNTEITPAHLLAALLDQEDGLAPAMLRKLGADTIAIQGRVDELIDGAAHRLRRRRAGEPRLRSRSSRSCSAPSARCRRSATSTSPRPTSCSR